MNIRVTTPGKLILMGEYAVLEGSPGLVMAVDRYARANFLEKQAGDYFLHSPTMNMTNIPFQIAPEGKVVFTAEIDLEGQKKLNFFIQTFERVIQQENQKNNLHPLEIILDTQDFFLPEKNQKLGLGSSAALTVALVQGLLVQLNPDDERISNPTKLFNLAEEIHYVAQGERGSGIDIAASCFGGMIHFQKNLGQGQATFEIHSVILPAELIIIPVWTGRSASTTALVNKVRNLKQKDPKRHNKLMQNLTDISSVACQKFSTNETKQYLDCCQEYYQLLKELGKSSNADIISDIHQEIHAIAKSSNSYYKPSGAGGGDIGLVLTDSREIEQKVSHNLLRSGFEIIKLNLSTNGSKIDFTDLSEGGE